MTGVCLLDRGAAEEDRGRRRRRRRQESLRQRRASEAVFLDVNSITARRSCGHRRPQDRGKTQGRETALFVERRSRSFTHTKKRLSRSLPVLGYHTNEMGELWAVAGASRARHADEVGGILYTAQDSSLSDTHTHSLSAAWL